LIELESRIARMAFGVATNNIFSLLDEENEDPQALANKASKTPEKPTAKDEPAAKPKTVPKTAGGETFSTQSLAD
jgi:hypothetical protein